MTGKKEKTRPKPSKPITRRLDAKALREALESVDKEMLSKALAGRSIESFIQGAEHLFDISVMHQLHDDQNFISLYDVDFVGNKDNTFKSCADNNIIWVNPPTKVDMFFYPKSDGYYLILTYAARTGDDVKKAHYQLDGAQGTLNLEDRPRWDLDTPIPVLAYLENMPHTFVFSGSQLVFRSISVWKF